jgi:hypothetical protein
VAFTTASLPPGTYSATIAVTDIQASNSPFIIPVRLTISANPPVIAVSPSSLTAVGAVGAANPPPQTFTVGNTGMGTLNFTVAETATWLTISTTSGSLAAGASQTVTVTFNTTTPVLPAGTHTATIRVSDPDAPNSPQNVTVTLEVYASPCTNPLAPGRPIGLAATVPDCNGYVAKLTWSPPPPSAGLGPVTHYYLYECSGSTTCTPTTRVATIPASATPSFDRSTPLKPKNAIYRWAVSAANEQCATNRRESTISNIAGETCN